MSSAATHPPRSTRDALLDAYRDLLEHGRGGQIRLVDVATGAGVSRQALYLHFANKADLLLALVERSKAEHRFDDLMAAVRRAPTADVALTQWLALHTEFTPRILRVARAIEREREADDALNASWQARGNSRRAQTEELARRLEREGLLAAHITALEASDLLWALTAPGFTEDLLVARRWSKDQLYTHLTTIVRSAILRPVRRTRKERVT